LCVALPVPAEIHARLASKTLGHNLPGLSAVIHPPIILEPGGFLSVPDQVSTRDMVVMADLGAPHPGELCLLFTHESRPYVSSAKSGHKPILGFR